MDEPRGTPFNANEFQHVLKQIRAGNVRIDAYTLFCIAEQVEANRIAIAELRRQFDNDSGRNKLYSPPRPFCVP